MSFAVAVAVAVAVRCGVIALARRSHITREGFSYKVGCVELYRSFRVCRTYIYSGRN